MNNKISIAVLALLSSSQAVQLKREPLATWAPSTKALGYDINYAVPHFGADNDVKNIKDDLDLAEKMTGHQWVLKDDPDPPKRDYFVPQFGVEDEIKDANKALAASEKQHGHKLEVVEQPIAEVKRNYFVPNFGEDGEITAAKHNLELVEKKFGTKLDITKDTDDVKRNYFVPNFGYDKDIEASLKSLAAQEKEKGKWNLKKDDYYVQLDEQRDPLLSWSPTPPKLGYKINYPVPNFGEDSDIMHSKKNEAEVSTKLGHQWVPTKDEDGEWELPSSQIEFKLMQKHARH